MNDKPILNTLTLGGSVILASLGLYFFGKSILNQIKRKQNAKDNQHLDDGGGGGNSVSQQEQLEIEQAKKYDPTSDAKTIRGYLDGWNFNSYGTEITELFNKLTNAKLIKLADKYKSMYNLSLYKQMDDETDACGYFFSDNCYDIPMKRLSALGKR